MDPIAIRELMPDFLDQGCPVDSVVTEGRRVVLDREKGDLMHRSFRHP
jgi:hypothetical protein